MDWWIGLVIVSIGFYYTQNLLFDLLPRLFVYVSKVSLVDDNVRELNSEMR